jgi:SanA protein
MRRFPFKRIAQCLLAAVFAAAVWCCYAAYSVVHQSAPFLYDDLAQVPKHRVGLFLGTSERLGNCMLNPYFEARVRAATDLFRQGKIEYILVSGDNGRVEYNEPAMAKAALITMGIPENRIVLDYAGFRTLDSVDRAHEVFGLSDFVVISQRFHNQRAVYLARAQGISAIGFNATDVTGYYGLRVHAREVLAKVRAVLDLKLGAHPKYLGPRIAVGKS